MPAVMPRALLRALGALLLAAAATGARALEPGSPAPDFTLKLYGEHAPTTTLSKWRGKVVLVDFWASWCGPCRQSMPAYVQLRDALDGKDFEILAVNLDESDADVAAFLKDAPRVISYPLLRDPAGDVPKAFGLTGMPTSYLIDQAGVVRARHTGFKPDDIATLRKEIDALLETHGDAHSPP